MITRRPCRFIVAPLACALSAAASAQTTDPQVEELRRQVDRLKVQTELLEQEKKLRDAQVGLLTPSTSALFSPRSGAIDSGDKLTFAIYLSALDPTRRVGAEICNKVADKLGAKRGKPPSVPSILVTVAPAAGTTAPPTLAHLMDQYRSLSVYVDRASEALARVAVEYRKELDTLKGVSKEKGAKEKLMEMERAQIQSVAGVVGAISAAGGLISGIAGFANMFRSQQVIGSVDGIVGTTELRAAVVKCLLAEYQVAPFDIDAHLLTDAEVADARKQFKPLEAARTALAEVLVLIRARKQDEKKDSGVYSHLDKMETDLGVVLAKADTAIDGLFTTDTQGVSRLITLARMKRLHDLVQRQPLPRLTLSVPRSGGYSQTVKRWIGNDRLYTSGGLSAAFSLYDGTGKLVLDEFVFGQSGWHRVSMNRRAPGPGCDFLGELDERCFPDPEGKESPPAPAAATVPPPPR